VGERVGLVTFMRDDLGYFDDETCRLSEQTRVSDSTTSMFGHAVKRRSK
jgi:hypothetical protein